ncbi:MAG: aryl-sulfate sulfotransferase [Chitinophagaceae bacterium]
MKLFFTLFLLTFLFAQGADAQPPNYSTSITGGPSSGYYLLSPFSYTVSGKYQLIIDGSGSLVYWKRIASFLAWDYKIQPNGQVSYFYQGGSTTGFILLDGSFRPIDTIKAFGFANDPHELQILPNGHYLLLASENSTQDLSSYNYFHGKPGSHTATVKSCVIQELDKNKNVVFEWHAKDHFAFNSVDSFWTNNSSSSSVDWNHANALELDHDGNILLSCRYFNEITKINRSTGDIMWRFGGKNNEFTFTTDSLPFYGQHDIQRQSNGNVTLFDDGNHFTPHGARALEYELDEVNKTAKLVWSYQYDPSMYSTAMGNAQRLASANTLVSYGSTLTNSICFNVVDTLGTELFKLAFDGNFYSYRCFYYPSLPWTLPRAQLECFDSLGTKYLRTRESYASYEWSDGSIQSSIAVTIPGTYYVYTPFGDGGHLRSMELVVKDLKTFCKTSPAAVAGLEKPEENRLFPNPADNELNFVFAQVDDHTKPVIRDIRGREYEVPGKLSTDQTAYIFDVSSLKPGLYLVVTPNTVDKFTKQ